MNENVIYRSLCDKTHLILVVRTPIFSGKQSKNLDFLERSEILISM